VLGAKLFVQYCTFLFVIILTIVASSREQLSLEEEQIIFSLPLDCQVHIRTGIILADLMSKCDHPLLTMQSLRHLMLGFMELKENCPDQSHLQWLSTRIRDISDQVDFDSNITSESECKVVASLALYDHALRIASEGGFQELLGRVEIARLYYIRSVFILSQFAPVPLSGQIIEEYRQMIEHRLSIVERKFTSKQV
jgi:hypothetical protein